MSRVAICVPAGDTVGAGFAYDLARMLTWTASTVELDLKLFLAQGDHLPDLRNAVLTQAVESGCTHALLLDGSMRFPKETLVHLLKRQLPVVAANYVTTTMPIAPVAMCRNTPIFSDEKASGLEKVDTVGLGVILIDCGALGRLSAPYCSREWSSVSLQHEDDSVYLCRKLVAAGVDILVDHDLSTHVKHGGRFEFRHQHAAALVETP